MHYTSGTTGTPKGVWSGLLDDGLAAALVAEEAGPVGLRRRGPPPGVLAPAPLGAHPLRRRDAAGRRGGRRPRRSSRRRPSPTAVDDATARPRRSWCPPTCSAFGRRGRPTSTRSGCWPTPASPCPEPLKHWAIDVFPDGSVWEFYGSTEGQFTACSGGGVGGAARARSVGPGPDAPCRSTTTDHLVHGARPRPLHLLARPGGDGPARGGATPSPSGTSGDSTTRATSTWTGGGTTSSSAAG